MKLIAFTLLADSLHNKLFWGKKQGERFRLIKRKLYDDDIEFLINTSVADKVLKNDGTYNFTK